jgi:hypothetical protein
VVLMGAAGGALVFALASPPRPSSPAALSTSGTKA